MLGHSNDKHYELWGRLRGCKDKLVFLVYEWCMDKGRDNIGNQRYAI